MRHDKTYYAQHPWGEHPIPTLTVGELIEKLQALDPTLPVVFESPQYGCFGSGTQYALDGPEVVELEAGSRTFEGGTRFDEETGKEEPYEGWTDTWPSWKGVVLK
jgi:hypothetical protein